MGSLSYYQMTDEDIAGEVNNTIGLLLKHLVKEGVITAEQNNEALHYQAVVVPRGSLIKWWQEKLFGDNDKSQGLWKFVRLEEPTEKDGEKSKEQSNE